MFFQNYCQKIFFRIQNLQLYLKKQKSKDFARFRKNEINVLSLF
eukprot:UN07784